MEILVILFILAVIGVVIFANNERRKDSGSVNPPRNSGGDGTEVQ